MTFLIEFSTLFGLIYLEASNTEPSVQTDKILTRNRSTFQSVSTLEPALKGAYADVAKSMFHLPIYLLSGTDLTSAPIGIANDFAPILLCCISLSII